MANPFQVAGAQGKPSRYAPIFINRMFTGLWTQRNPLREAAVPYMYEKFYGGARHDSLIDGQNVELGNHLTLIRAPGSTVYNSQIFPSLLSFYSFHTSTTDTEAVQVIADSAGYIYDATGPNTKEAILSKASGAGASFFQAVGPTLFIADGVENKKYRKSMSPTGGVLPNWGIDTPINAPNNQPAGYVGEPCRYWAPDASLQAGYTVLDSNGYIQLMTGNSQQSSTTTSTIYPAVSTQGTIPGTLPVTVSGSPTFTTGFVAHTSSGEVVTDASLAVDGDPNTSAGAAFIGHNAWAVGTWAFSYSGQTPTQLTLNVNSGITSTKLIGTPMNVGVWYSLDGGTTWTAVWSQTTPSAIAPQWYPVTIPPNTNVNNILVCAYVQAHDDAAIQVYEINLVVGTTTVSTPTTKALTTGPTLPKWSTSLYSLTVDGQAIWQNQGAIGSWQASTLYSANGPTGAIVDLNGNLQVIKSAGTTGATNPGTGTLTFTGVAVGGGNAVYTYSASTGPTPIIGQPITIGGFTNSGNNLTTVISAVGGGTVTVVATTQVNETHAGVAQLGWSTIAGQSTPDGSVVWLCCGPGQVVAFSGWQHAYSYHCTDSHVSTASPLSLNTGPVLGSIAIRLSGDGSPDTQCDQIWIWRTLDGGTSLLLDDQYGAGTLSISDVSVITNGTLTFTSVAVTGGNAVYAYSASTGVTPSIGQMVAVSGFVTAGNNVTAQITAVNPGVSITVATTTQVNETHAGTGGLTDTQAIYTYVVVDGARPHIGQTITITLLGNASNNGVFVVTAVDWTLNTFTVANSLAIAASGQVGKATTPAPGTGTWTVTDIAGDNDLNEFIEAPIDHENDPPPAGFVEPTYHMGRIFGAVGNTVYYSNGPDTTTGDGNQSFPPLNYFVFPSLIRRLVPYLTGLLVFTVSDIYLIQGAGTSTSRFYAVPYIIGVGLESYWELCINGALIYFKSSDGQVLSLNPSAGMEQIGFPIGDKFKVGGGFN